MPLVFVHGVNNRTEDSDYEPRRLLTERFLQKYLAGATINGKQLPLPKPAFPYWGDLATRFAWDMKSLPSGAIDALGGPGVEDSLRPIVALVRDALDDPASAEDEPLLTLAKKSFPLSVEVLTELVLQQASGADADDAARFAIAAQTYASKHTPPSPPPAWLAGVTTDQQFLGQLLATLQVKAPGVDALGVMDSIANALAAGAARLKQAVGAATGNALDKVGDFASTKVLAWTRRSFNATLGRFFGDVFIYLNGRGDAGAPGPIPKRILGAWDQAIAAAGPNEPLVIVGHSLGGVISFDLLSAFRPDLVVDLFVSVGSQVSHFEEMKLFRSSRPDIPSAATQRAPKPPNIRHWINVLDEVDIFSYACERVFDGVRDLAYDTRTYVIKAHGAYFQQARFYQRLRARIDELPAG